MPTISTSEIDTLSATFAALSDPTRRAMLTRLSLGEASVNELAAPFNMSLPAVSKHIKVLEKAGLLTKTRNAQQRPCKIDGVQLKQAVDWLQQYTINNIAVEAINTPATDKNTFKKKIKVEKTSKTAIRTQKEPQKPPKTLEKPHDNNDPDDLQQQIGFDF